MEDRLSLLAALKSAHTEVLAAVDAFERILRGPHPGDVVLTNIRLKLTVINGRKRVLLERIYATLGELDPGDAERIRTLRADAAVALARASGHIARWTRREMAKDWSAYCAESRPVPATSRARIAAERRLLYPLLGDGDRKAA